MNLKRWRGRERELQEEIEAHLRLAAEEQVERGAKRAGAERAARREFGNVGLVMETTRGMWGWGWLERLKQDLFYAARTSRRTPAFTAIVVVTLALGIGANTAIFSILYAVLLRPLPYRDANRMVAIWGREIHEKGTSKLFDLYADYENWKAHSSAFEGFGAVTWAGSIGRTLTGRGPAQGVVAEPVSADFFQLLGVPAALGRTFQQDDGARGCSVVLAHNFWQSVLGSETGLVGQSLRLDGQACTVLGVMPGGFSFYPPVAQMWILMPQPQRPDVFSVGVFGRLKAGVTIAQAQSEILRLHRQIHEHDRWGAQVEPVVYDLHGEFTFLAGNNLKLSLIVLFAAVGFVLLICCVNVANLLMGRSLGRSREMAIRAALGSGRARLIRQLLTESVLLSVLALVAGIGLTELALRYFQAANPIELPPGTVVSLNEPVLGFSACLCILTALLFGLYPAWKGSRTALNDALKAGGRTSQYDAVQRRFGRLLIVLEVALTVVLLVGAGLLIRSLERFASAPLGFQPDQLVTASLRLPRSYAKPQQRAAFYDRIQSAAGTLPQIQGSALSSAMPEGGAGNLTVVAVEGRPDPGPDQGLDTTQQAVTPGFFRVMEIPLQNGRDFDESDRAETEPVAIVDEALVQKYFPNENPIGRHIREYRPDDKAAIPWLRIVGVVGNKKMASPYNEMTWRDWPMIYRPLAQNEPASVWLVARTAYPRDVIGGALQRKIAAIDPDVPLGDVGPVTQRLARNLAYPRFRATVLAGFSGLALLLAVVGLYGILSHQVTQRTQEIGIRMALGAPRAEVRWMVLKEGMRLTGCGLAAGLGAAVLLGRALSSMLYGTQANDPMLLTIVSAGILLTALTAAYFPARRATGVDPVIALRDE